MPSCLAFFRSVREQAKTALQGKLPAENSDFEKNFARVLDVRKDLLAIETGVKKWLISARGLATSAKNLAKAVQTAQRDIDAYSQEMDTLLDDLVVLKSVTKKIGLLDDLIRQRYHLRDLRQIKEGYERKLQQLEEQDRAQAKKGNAGTPSDFDVQINTVQGKIQGATEKYETELAELSAAVTFFVKEAGEEGGTKLLAPELSAFRSSQFQFFLLCQKLIAGQDTDITDLESQWKAFARRMSTTVANARGVKAAMKDGESHVKWGEDLIADIPRTNGMQEDDDGDGRTHPAVANLKAKANEAKKSSEASEEDDIGPTE
jgi:chromosome segregation ATPase